MIPTPAKIRAARLAARLTQSQAAELVCSKLRTWQQWEAGDRGMHPGLWMLFELRLADNRDKNRDKSTRFDTVSGGFLSDHDPVKVA
jgi:transcriptional regulator with XRE-family HTH domain